MNQHADWEHLQACLFDVFVCRTVGVDRDRVEGEFPLAPYDIDSNDYSWSSWISCRSGAGTEFAFVRFISVREPFDEVEGVAIEPTTHRRGVVPGTRWVTSDSRTWGTCQAVVSSV